MKRQLVNSLIAGVFGMVFLGACSTNPAPVVNPGTMTGESKADTPSDGFGMGGGLMGGGIGGGFPTFAPSEKSYGVVTFDREDGGHAQSLIDERGTSFADIKYILYYSGSPPRSGGGLGKSFLQCIPKSSYLTVGKSGTIRFARKNNSLFARITLRMQSGKLVPVDASKTTKPEPCGKESAKVQKPESVGETILTKTLSVSPGKETIIKMGKTTVMVSLDKDFPVDRVSAYPAWTIPTGGARTFGGGMMGGIGG